MGYDPRADRIPERRPLLRPPNTQNVSNNEDPVPGPGPVVNFQGVVVEVEDLPLPSQDAIGNLLVGCGVCPNMIDFTGKEDRHVVKCQHCGEATPIRRAPPGKKFVRCPCNCLLVCKSTSQRIACPRANCKRMIPLQLPPPGPLGVPQVPGMCRVTCGHCQDEFFFNLLHNALAKCPYCNKTSSVGPALSRTRCVLFLMGSLFVLGVTIVVMVFTFSYAAANPWMYAIYAAALALAVLMLLRSGYYYVMKISFINEGSST